MRILEVIAGLGLGGAELSLCNRLECAHQAETLVISTRPHLNELAERICDSAKLVPFSSSTNLRKFILANAHTFRADVILFHNPKELMRFALLTFRPSPIPVISIVHSDRITHSQLLNMLLIPIMWIANRRILGSLAVSSAASHGSQAVGVRQMSVQPLGAKESTGIPSRYLWPKETERTWLFLGRLVPSKNVANLIRAIVINEKRLREQRVHLVVAGEGPEKGKLERLIKDNDIGDLVTIAGFVTDVDGLYLAADVVLITSSYEGGPLTLVEALVAGCRIASTRVGILDDVLMNESDIKVFTNSGVHELAIGISELAFTDSLGSQERVERQQRFKYLSLRSTSKDFYLQITRMIGRESS